MSYWAGRRVVHDLETDGLLDEKGDDIRIWCGVVTDVDDGETKAYRPGELEQMAEDLQGTELYIGHNVAQFDIPVMQVRFPDWPVPYHILDTLQSCRMAYFTSLLGRSIRYRNMAGRSEKAREARMPKALLGQNSLEAWGYRLGEHKGEYLKQQGGAASEFTEELLAYCVQDVKLNVKLFHHLLTRGADKGWPPCTLESLVAESRFAYILGKQMRNGVGFDSEGAQRLEAELRQREHDLTMKAREFFPAWIAPEGGQKDHCPFMEPQKGDAGYTVPKKTRTMKKGLDWPSTYTAGAAYTKVKLVEFKPGSNRHVGMQLQKHYGWQPEEYGADGFPTVDEATLATLDYPCIPTLLEYAMVKKRLGAINGKKGWLPNDKDGIIYGRINASGTRTSRCSHNSPNLGQVPKVKVAKDPKTGEKGPVPGLKGKYGLECRSLFHPTRSGWVQVGCDASGIELRMLAHRLAYYDGGAFGVELLQGDPHSDWQKLTGLFSRDKQKTFTYALLYGAGDEKLGTIVLDDWRGAFEGGQTDRRPFGDPIELGKHARGKLLAGLEALDMLLKACKRAHKQGWFHAMDGRILPCPSEHGSLNDLLQSDGAIVMKHAAIILDDELWRGGYVDGRDYAYMLNVHDEWQIECPEHHAEEIGTTARAAIIQAGEDLGVRITLDGEYKIGSNWAETH